MPLQQRDQVPLLVDVEALLGADPLIETVFACLRESPALLLHLPRWLARGRLGVWQGLARHASQDRLVQCYRPDVLDYLRAQKTQGRALGLIGGADEAAASAVARDLGLFDVVWTGTGFGDMSGGQRRDALRRQFGGEGFDLLAAGGETQLLQEAGCALLVAPSRARLRELAGVATVTRVFAAPGGGPMDYVRALRPHHWIKNILLFVAIGAAHRWPDARTLVALLLAFAAFCACASSSYLLNDLFDLEADASHAQTRHRQLASRLIRPSRVLLLIGLLLVAAIAICCRLPVAFACTLAAYFLLTSLYSIRLKEIAVLDVLVLAGGYALRVGAGSFVVDIRPSAWLMALCMFLFLSLALIKRYAELVAVAAEPGAAPKTRGYLVSDEMMIAAEGIASGYVAVLVLALYTNTSVAQRLYGRHEVFWVICLLLLYWINYLWLMARRGRIDHDPLVFALRDRTSLLLIVAMGVATAWAL